MSKVNLLIAAIVPCLFGVFAWQHFHAAPPPSASSAQAIHQFDECYEEDAVQAVVGVDEDDAGLPNAWHRQMNVFMAAHRESPKDLPADIMALPDLSGWGSLPNLRVAVAHERENGGGELFKLLQRLHDLKFENLARTDDSVRQDVKSIMFLWLGVDKIKPDSRGPFVDARELAFVEKLLNDKFLQLGRFPNPAPMAADGIKQSFALLWDYFYADIAVQGPAKPLFIPVSQVAAAGHYLNEATFTELGSGAHALPRPEDRLLFWENVIRAIPPDLMQARLTEADWKIADAAIRASGPELTLEQVLAAMHPKETTIWRDRLGRHVRFQVVYNRKMNHRMICYEALDK